jgi:hypothetical protein
VVIRVSARDPALQSIIEDVAAATDVPYRALHLQTLMHLPRLADPDGEVPDDQAAAETKRVADFVPRWPEWGPPPPAAEESRTWRVYELEETCARDIMERFHYLRSPRTDARHYGLWTAGSQERPAAAASVSENDVPLLQDLAARGGASPGRSRVLSRVFAFPWAPRNAISGLLARVGRAERSLGAEMLLTYVNPNLGFTGVSYRASNWALVGNEPVQGYSYLDRRYVTSRELDRRFGSHDSALLAGTLGDRLSRSVMRLEPLLVFARGRDSDMQK